MNLRLLSIVFAALAFGKINALEEWLVVNVTNNKIGLKVEEVRVCKYNPEKEKLFCILKTDEPMTFDNIESTEGSSTGTPPWLQYKDNYVGYSDLSSGNDKMGSGRRKIYFKK